MFIYNLLPKWLLVILVVVLLVSGAYVGIKMEYYRIDNAKLTNDNKILTDNVAVLQSSLDTCTKSLKAEADNATRTEVIHKDTQTEQQNINKICVKEEGNVKTNIKDAIIESNKISGRFNSYGHVSLLMWSPDKDYQNGYSGKLYVAYAACLEPDPSGCYGCQVN